MVVCAVRYELVSGENSLLTGELTGNFSILGSILKFWPPFDTQLQRLAAKFPTQWNRELFWPNREFAGANREFI
jgi:hypothetical protein